MHSARHHRVCLVIVMLTVIASCPHAPMMHIDASHDSQVVLIYFSGFLFCRVLCDIVIVLIERGPGYSGGLPCGPSWCICSM